jgi:hypothetical protein
MNVSCDDPVDCSVVRDAFNESCGHGEVTCASQGGCCEDLETFLQSGCPFSGKQADDDDYGCELYNCHINEPVTCLSWNYDLLADCGYGEETCVDVELCCETVTGFGESGCGGKKDIEFPCECVEDECATLRDAFNESCGLGEDTCAGQSGCCEDLETFVQSGCEFSGKQADDADYGCVLYGCHIDEPATCLAWSYDLMADCDYGLDECEDIDLCCESYAGFVENDCGDEKDDDIEFPCDCEGYDDDETDDEDDDGDETDDEDDDDEENAGCLLSETFAISFAVFMSL